MLFLIKRSTHLCSCFSLGGGEATLKKNMSMLESCLSGSGKGPGAEITWKLCRSLSCMVGNRKGWKAFNYRWRTVNEPHLFSCTCWRCRLISGPPSSHTHSLNTRKELLQMMAAFGSSGKIQSEHPLSSFLGCCGEHPKNNLQSHPPSLCEQTSPLSEHEISFAVTLPPLVFHETKGMEKLLVLTVFVRQSQPHECWDCSSLNLDFCKAREPLSHSPRDILWWRFCTSTFLSLTGLFKKKCVRLQL